MTIYVDGTDSGRFNQDQMYIGLGGTWSQTVAIAMHEILEMACAHNNVRWLPDFAMGNSGDSYMFIMNHPQFTEVVAQAADCLAAVLPEIGKQYNKRH